MISLWRILYLLILVPVPVIATVTERIAYKSYIVNHKAGESLLLSLNKSAPVCVKGKAFHGCTYHRINWVFGWKEGNGNCYIRNSIVTLTVDITLPELHTTDDKMNMMFVKYSDSLYQHELGHLKLAQEAANKIDKGIASLPARTSCSLLEKTANQLAHYVLDELDKDSEKYDISTQHGRTQGVFLPGQYVLATNPCDARWCRFIRSLFGYEE